MNKVQMHTLAQVYALILIHGNSSAFRFEKDIIPISNCFKKDLAKDTFMRKLNPKGVVKNRNTFWENCKSPFVRSHLHKRK